MRLGVMQPYFMPYIGYWQLVSAVDAFVVYDNIQYAKKGWINRNRFLQSGKGELFTIPLQKGSDFSNIAERRVAREFDASKLLRRLEASYRKAPQFRSAFPVVRSIITSRERNLFRYLLSSIRGVLAFLELDTPIIASSSVDIDHSLRGQDKVIALCEALGATSYVNAIGGQALYSKPAFMDHGIVLGFLRSRPIRYAQYGNDFVPDLSIVDVMMFNSRESIREMLDEYDLV